MYKEGEVGIAANPKGFRCVPARVYEGNAGSRSGGVSSCPGGPLETTAAYTTSQTTTSTVPAEERAILAARVAEDNKAKDIVVLDLRGLTPLYDYFVIMTGASRRQMHTLADEIEAAFKSVGDRRLSTQGYQASRWIVQDFGDILIHVFDQESREYYALEDLWADARRVDWQR